MYVQYNMADFYIPAGRYTLEDLEELVARVKEIKGIQNAALQRSMKQTKDLFEDHLNAARSDQK
jgi:hypothetical protein